MSGDNAQQQDDVEVKTAFGSVHARGANIPMILAFVAAIAVPSYLVWEHDRDNKDNVKALAVDRAAQFKSVADQQKKLQDTMDSMVYVLTLAPEDRARLKLDMPDALWNKMQGRQRQ